MFWLRLICFLLAVVAVPFFCRAQVVCWTANGGGGYSAVTGTDGSSLSGRWNAQAGLGLGILTGKKVSFFVTTDYLFDQTSVKMSALTQAKNLDPNNVALQKATSGTSSFNVFALDPTLRVSISSRAEVYAFGGFGWFRRQVDLTGVSNEGSLLQPGNPSVFLRDTASGSVDGGGGVNFRVWNKKWGPYVEVRVVHGLAVNHSTTIVPFAAGLRW
jgi:hypothetical protein